MFAEDLSVFFQTADFAVAAVYTPNGGQPVTKKVIFDQQFLDNLGIVTGTDPKALAIASDFASWSNADLITINGVSYRVTGNQPQGDGATTILQLEDRT